MVPSTCFKPECTSSGLPEDVHSGNCEIFTVRVIKNTVFWGVTPCGLIISAGLHGVTRRKYSSLFYFLLQRQC